LRPFTLIFAYLFCSIILCFFSSTVSAQMEFVENKGQWHADVTYRGDFNTGSFFMENGGFTVLLHKPEDVQRMGAIVHGHDDAGAFKNLNDPFTFHSFAYKVKFLGASLDAVQVPDKVLPTYNNYYIGNDRSKWASECKVFTAVTYQDVYPNVDVRYYSDAGKLKYDFIVRPGGKVADIALQYDGVSDISVIDKELVLATPVGEVKELYPYTYQSGEGKRTTVNARYMVSKNVVTFRVDDYNPKETLVIDPSVIFSTFTGSKADNWGYTATPGPDGSFYAGGVSFATGYPTSPGAYQTTYGGGTNEGGFGGYDVAIFKFTPNGANRVYATYLGGGGNEQPHSMIVDPQGNLIVAGRTTTANFPSTIPSVAGSGYDIFVTKFNATGSALIGSVKMGGPGDDGVNIKPKYPQSTPAATSLRRNYGDDARSEVILDAANNVYLVSSTQSTGTSFPRVNPLQASFGGGLQDGVIIKFNSSLTSILFSTYFGGNGDDACFVASISPTNGDLYVAGATASTDLPGNTTGVIDPTFNGGIADGFITQVKSDGSAIVRTTYQGTTGIDLIYGLKFDRSGFPYITGTTTGNWQVVNANFSHVFGANHAKQFISKLQPDLSAYVYSTVFGTNISVPNLSPTAFLVDRCENVYVSGWGGGINVQQGYTTGTTSGLPNVNPLAGIPPPDGKDFYFFVLEKNANAQLFGSHFGQNGGLGDHVDGGTSRFDDNGVIYQAICANCAQGAVFPTTPGSWSTVNGSNNCNQASIKIEMNFAGVGAGVQASINAVVNDTTGCVPLVVDFSDTLRKGKKFYWNFGDGSAEVITTSPSISHTYTAVGTYNVRLIAEDSTTCNIRDTAFITIIAGNNRAKPDFTFAKIAPCESLTMQYTNTSTAVGSFGPKTFIWDYGDGSPRDTSAFAPPRLHTYAAAGTYKVKLIILDTAFCNSPDSIEKTIRLNPLVKARFETDPFGCVPYAAVFENTSLAGTDFLWEFGDGTTSTVASPTHTYTTTGTFNVRLVATDTNTCNRVDTSAYFTITVLANPTAQFSWQPDPPQENTPVQFTNLSVGAVSYLWNFGDGDTSTLVNPFHQYNATGTYLAELIAYNAAGCSDTFRLQVSVIVIPLLDVPNAFIPAQGGRNAIVKVEGFGISKMAWKIYNRWGQLVFQSTNKNAGWNGYYKGKLQPTDVYAYTLDAEFTDGKKLRKTGDITLLR
jgi:gliding motility-associated-like protein